MDAVRNDIQNLVSKELTAANKRYPLFASPHEGYAVLMEEAQELEECIDHITEVMNMMWHSIRGNNDGAYPYHVKSIYGFAVDAACEAVQVAAMCAKWHMSAERWYKKKE